MKNPSLKTIKDRLGHYLKHDHGDNWEEIAKEIKTLIDDCMNGYSHSKRERTMIELNEVLKGCGVEALPIEDQYTDHYWQNFIGEFINFGDTYATTIIYIADSKYLTPGFKITSWGDIVEKYYMK